MATSAALFAVLAYGRAPSAVNRARRNFPVLRGEPQISASVELELQLDNTTAGRVLPFAAGGGVWEWHDLISSRIHIQLKKRPQTKALKSRTFPTAMTETGERSRIGESQHVLLHQAFVNLTRSHLYSPFVGQIAIGSPAQHFDVIFDTGSTHLFVTARECRSATCKAGHHHMYDFSKSNTFIPVEAQITVQYASGKVQGLLGKDRFHLGAVTIENQAFGRIEYEDGGVFGQAFDGICGLGFPSLGGMRDKLLFTNLVDQKAVVPGQISFYFDTNAASGLILGEVDSTMYHGPMLWLNLNKAFYWQVDLIDITIGPNSLKKRLGDGQGLCPGRASCNLVFDTGTSVLTCPSGRQKALEAMMTEQDRPGDICYVVESRAEPVPAPSGLLETRAAPTRHTLCMSYHGYLEEASVGLVETLNGGVVGLRGRDGAGAGSKPDTVTYRSRMVPVDIANSEGPLYIAGMPFMEQYLTTYDYSGRRVGVARSRRT